jgi:mannosyltransferase
VRSGFLSYTNDRIERRLWLWFLIVVIVNVGFRIIGLDYSSFWYDEIISVQSASLEFGHIKHVSEWDNNPPFYYYCLNVWISLFGDSEFNVRLLSVVFSAVAGGVMFLFCNRFFNKTVAIIASFLYLSSNMLFFYSHEARAYSLSVLLTLIASWIFLSMKEKPDYKNSLLLGLVNFLIIYTHYITGLALIVQGICMLFYFEKKSKLRFLLSVLLTIALVLLRFTKKQFLLITGFNSSEHSFWLGKSTFSHLTDVLSEIFFSNSMLIPLLGIILAGTVLVLRFKKTIVSLNYVYCFSIGLGSVFVLYFLGKVTPVFLDRYLLFTVPFVIILIAVPLSYLRYKMIPIVVSVAFFVVSAFHINYQTDKGMDYRSAVLFIKAIKTPQDLIIVKTKDVKPLFGYYYDSGFLHRRKQALPDSEQVIFCSSWADVNQDVSRYARVIVVDSYQDLNPNETEFVTKLSEKKRFRSISNYYRGVRISIYK